MESTSDGRLLAAFRAGDATAFDELVERHQAVLLKHARSLLGSGGPYEDAVQDVFLKLVQIPPEMPADATDPQSERAHLLSWLHTVTRNACMDVIRADSRRKNREERAAASEVVNAGTTPAEERDTLRAVEQSLERLPGDQREVLVLRLLGGRSYREIAEITGRKVGTVGWLVSVGLKALGTQLAPLLEGAPARAMQVRPAADPAPRGGLRFAQGETS